MGKNKYTKKQLFALRQLGNVEKHSLIEIECMKRYAKQIDEDIAEITGWVSPATVAKFTERKKQAEKRIDELIKRRNDLISKIGSIPDEVLSRILYLRYVKGETVIAISFKLNYSDNHISRLHRSALDAFADKLGYSEE